ncbi:MAG TPA: energy transducer TonB [Gemmatimonadaceae bacterium]
MLSVLVESRKARRRGWRGVAASVVVHAMVIGGAVYATAAATEPPRPREVIAMNIPLPTADPGEPAHGGGGARTGAAPTPPDDPALPAPPRIPTAPMPPIDVPTISLDSVLAHPMDLSGGTARGDASARGGRGVGGSGADGVFDPAGVDRLAEPLPGNPRPDYPAALREAGVTGAVTARFVIDSTGRVEPRSITFDGDPNALFAAAVRSALARSRYQPAEVRGRAVRVLARQDFLFSLK